MKVTEILEKEGLINAQKVNEINDFEKSKPFSVHWELRVLLYLGVLMFTGGTSVLVYSNIDTIGHQIVLACILILCVFGFYYSFKKRLPYSHQVVKQESPFPDYALLASCLLLGLFIGYLQGAYEVFGYHYGLATFIPAVVYFYCAYVFDHKGVLSLGITGIAAWAGLAVTPAQLLKNNDFSSTHLIYTAILLGSVYAAIAWFSQRRSVKAHFAFTYNNFALNILFIATLSALFMHSWKIMSFLFLAFITWYYLRIAITESSFLFLFLSVLYAYIGLTYSLMELFSGIYSELIATFWLLYIVASCTGIILFFINYKRILKKA